jgi:hypothetical protein
MIEQFQICSHIAVPPRKGREPNVPFRELGIGQSFFVPYPQDKRLNPTYWRRATGFKFTYRRIVEGGIDGIHVWRIA